MKKGHNYDHHKGDACRKCGQVHIFRHTKEFKEQRTIKYKGKGNPNYGKHPVPWNKDKKGLQKSSKKGKTREEFYGTERAKEITRKQSKSCEESPKFHRPRTTKEKEKDRVGTKKYWKNLGPETRRRRGLTISKLLTGKMAGGDNPNWKGGLSFEPYGPNFNGGLKKLIKERDNYTCQSCNSTDELCIHHINYNKKNNKLDNLITLCKGCNSLMNSNRGFWTTFWREGGVVDKGVSALLETETTATEVKS